MKTILVTIWSLFRDRHTHTSPLYIDRHRHHLLADEIRFERRPLAATFTIAFRFYIKIPSLHLSFAFPMCGLHKAPRVMMIKLVQFGLLMGDGNTIMVCW